MILENFLQALDSSAIASALRESDSAFPWIESIHVFAISLVVGTILIVDLRLIGYRSHRPGVAKLSTDLLPYTWVAFGVAVGSGILLFMSNVMKYAENWQFQVKMVLIIAAGLNMLVFHMTSYRNVRDWDVASPPPVSAQLAGGASLCLWISVIFFGRWIGFAE